MPTVTISLPKELKERLDRHKEVNWSEIFRRAFENKVRDLEEFERFKRQRGAHRNENIAGTPSKKPEE